MAEIDSEEGMQVSGQFIEWPKGSEQGASSPGVRRRLAVRGSSQ
ncbi:MAG: hypothetical protein WAW42_01640 [Candidatus Competibacteraceae bacterium]